MTTTLYFHAASSTVSGTLPSTAQFTAATIHTNMDAFTVNRTMDTTIGTTQTSIAKALTGSTDPYNVWVTRFLSGTLAAQTISANTWTYYDANKSSAGAGVDSWPGEAGTSGNRYGALYVWRPSTGAVVGTIYNGLSATTSAVNGPTAEHSSKLTWTGTAVTCLAGDVLAIEVLGSAFKPSAATDTWYYDGSVQSTTDNTATSNMASGLVTPQTLSFVIPPIDCTVTWKALTNKIIHKF